MAKGQANASYRLRNEGKMSSTHRVNRLAEGERELGELKPGECIQAVSWTVLSPANRLRVGMRATAGYTAAFLYMGAAKIDRPWTEDELFKTMYAMGWQPIDPAQRKVFMAKVKS